MSMLNLLSEGPDLWLLEHPSVCRAEPPVSLTELEEYELERGATFVKPASRMLFTSAHIVLRRVVATYLGVRPQEVRFVREDCPGCGGPHGRPAVAGTPPPLHFSLSHGHGLVLVGVGAVPLGVDVERLPRPQSVDACTAVLHPAERAELADLRPQARQATFGQLWTRKEAYLKGIGTGLSRDLAADYLGADPAGRPAGWTIIDVPCGSGHVAAAAVMGAAPASVSIRWLPDEVLYASDATEFLAT